MTEHANLCSVSVTSIFILIPDHLLFSGGHNSHDFAMLCYEQRRNQTLFSRVQYDAENTVCGSLHKEVLFVLDEGNLFARICPLGQESPFSILFMFIFIRQAPRTG